MKNLEIMIHTDAVFQNITKNGSYCSPSAIYNYLHNLDPDWSDIDKEDYDNFIELVENRCGIDLTYQQQKIVNAEFDLNYRKYRPNKF